ncbi:uncharacterized protein LOC123314371 isoform X2 [Coccinella septempunctata]|uniref:uncharacterized protein LOC123314371 isoform X2 n=1 Tax=Coccinella septempunctata TaxID=41139 RepID=UPI001D091A96|nr:uncharacterized protein LOC123314371 isoform X2 [Coccinella septempunctata]
MLRRRLIVVSSFAERIVVLKFLTTMATNSSHLSKDILTHVNFNLSRIEFLSLSKMENKAVRKHFVYFLTALLIDIEYPVLSLLLSKKGLLTSIIPGLTYDEADTVCFILTAMKSSILENPAVSKTIKMKTFNTIVVKNIVNLYNWKGPRNLKSLKGEEPKISVNEVQKARVSQCVHEFLMILCTSHKYGVIFRDPLVGIGKKTQNALIYTVVDSMDSPWEHSYASELVIKICSACPDITKYIWNNIKTVLEPRFSPKWLKLVEFVKRLLVELNASCLEPCIKKLTAQQICTVITALVAPIPVLKVMISENGTYDLQSVKYQVFSLISLMLKSIESYLSACKNWLSIEKYNKLKNYLAIHIERNFPMSDVLLKNWNTETKKEEDKSFNLLEGLSIVFDIFEHYINLCPELLSTLGFSHDDLKKFLESVMSLSSGDSNGEKEKLQVQIIDIYLSCNPSLFALESDSFDFFLSLLFRICYENVENSDFKGISVLRKLLKSTGIFDYALDRELNVWINGIFSLKSYKDTVPEFIAASIKLANLKATEYFEVISQYQESFDDDNNYPVSGLGPMFLGILDHFCTITAEKSILSYMNFVIPNLIFLQYDFRIISQIITNRQSLYSPLQEYIDSILSDVPVSFEIPKVLRILGKENVFNCFNVALANDSFESFLNENLKILYPDLQLDLLQMGIFYLSRLMVSDNPQKVKYSKNLTIYINFILDKTRFDPDIILSNSSFIQNFSILEMDSNGELNFCTNFLIDFIKCYTEKFDLLDSHMKFFHKKILRMTFKILKHPKKYNDFQVTHIMNLFRLSSETYLKILIKISDCVHENIDKCKFKVFYSILVHSLEKYCQSNVEQFQCLSEDVLSNLLTFCISLNQQGEIKSFELSKQFLTYFSLFPEKIECVGSDFVSSIVSLKEYQKANTDLIVFILKRRDDLFPSVEEKLEDIIFVKGMFYPILQLLNDKYLEVHNNRKEWLQELFRKIYNNFEEVLHKTLRKPQKASQHLDDNYRGVCLLIDLNFQKEKFQEYISKVLKFEVTKIFHVHLLNTIFRKFIATEIDSSEVNNQILTFVHLLLNALKRIPKNEEHIEETLNTVCDCLITYLDDLNGSKNKSDFTIIRNNESFKVMLKFLLKYGVCDYEKLLQLLCSFISIFDRKFDHSQIELIMEMLISHSGFLDVLLSENHKCKKGVLSLMTIICESWPQFMARSHIPKLLASYGATMTETDRMILKLIKMYESVRDEVSFQDFRPYLWGNAGAIHYSVRIDIGEALLKQPKIKDVLNILQEHMVLSTIKNYHLYKNGKNSEELDANTIYDLEFLLPLFIHLLSPENVVQTYQFARSGALSLTLLGLSCPEENMRAATCDALSRFYFHLEARQKGKDNFLYMKLITGICMWMSDTEIPMNNFASIFLSRTALILSKPSYNQIMLPQLSHYLVAKDILDLSTIPELYTYLHSPDVHYKDHRQFIFEILKDGLIVENDFKIFSRSMSLKLLTELYSTRTCDRETRLSILDIFIALCRSRLGVELFCTHSSLLQFFYMEMEETLALKEFDNSIIIKMKELFRRISLYLDFLNVYDKTTYTMIMNKIDKCI